LAGRPRRKGFKAGASPHKIVLAEICRLVLSEREFQQFRQSAHEELRHARDMPLENVLTLFKIMKEVSAPDSAAAQTSRRIREESARYLFDNIEDGDWLFFQMVATGELPDFYYMGEVLAVKWQPTIYIPASEDFDSVVRQFRRLLRREWPNLTQHWPDRSWAERIPLASLTQYARWYFVRRVKGRSVRSIAMAEDEATSESTVERGIRAVERLLEIKA
jgi:hypothetical protein